MEKLPNELLVHILSFLDPTDIIKAQSVSRRFLSVARDTSLWKTVWWDSAHAPRRLVEQPVEGKGHLSFLWTRATANTLSTPSLPGRKTDFYEEYIAAHAPICASWVCESRTDRDVETGYRGGNDEAVGLGLYYNDGTRQAEKIFSPMDDGSISVWNISRESTAKRGALLDRTQPGQVAGKRGAMGNAATHHVDNVDCGANKGYFAVDATLTEVDLHTLQTVSQHEFPFNITTLSEARHPVPMTVGTTDTIHLHDVRQAGVSGAPDFSTRCDSIADADTRSSVCGLDPSPVSRSPVCQHKPLSILHLPSPGAADVGHSIWVAGRFPSLLHYDRRHFPKLAGNIYSGGNLSSLTYMPHPFVDWDRHAFVDGTDTTIVAAGDYKGKGSLELYGVSAASSAPPKQPPRSTNRNSSLFRITAVAAQGARLVASDGHGNLTWWYRDGRTKARTFNINDSPPSTEQQQQNLDHLFAQHASDVPEYDLDHDPPHQPDMVMKIRPTVAPDSTASPPLNTNDLVVQTDNGRVGLVSFGEAAALEPAWHEAAQSAEELALRRRERAYAGLMRVALEEHTRELSWMGGLGLVGDR